jgi:serine protease Do
MNTSMLPPVARRFPLVVALAVALLLTVSPVGAGDEGAFLGITSTGLSGDDAREAGLTSRDGAILHAVYSGTAADAAGLREGDVLLTFGGEKIFDDRDLTEMIHRREPGDAVSITLIRDGEKMTVEAVLGTRGDMEGEYGEDSWGRFWDGVSSLFGGHSGHRSGPRLGVYVDEMGEQMAEYFEVEEGEGVLLTQIMRNSPAEDAGLRAGDVVIQVDDSNIRRTGDISRALRNQWGETVQVSVIRKGDRLVIPVTLEEE